MREACLHGDRVTRERFVALNEDVVGCDVAEELLQPGTQFEPLEAPCPVTIAWAAEDRLFPLSIYEERARTLVGGSQFLVLDDVGHVPMCDDPQLVADTIRETAARASSSGAALSSRGS
jgi:pimeloyl-ACP methyl ester carboxylesterase